jgi:hypothetical protein
MAKTSIIIVAVVAVIVVVAALGAFVLSKEDSKDESKVLFFIEDEKGSYFWIEGSGERADAALKDAANKSGVDLIYTESSSMGGMYLTGINGLEGDDSHYWSLHTYTDGEWKSAQAGISNVESKDNKYLGWAYVEFDSSYNPIINVDFPDVKNASPVNLSHSGDNVTFLVHDGQMYFWISGHGSKVSDAFTNAFLSYPSGTATMNNYGISSLFGIASTSVPDDEDNYIWWGQYAWGGNAWEYLQSSSMTGISSQETDYYLVVYGTGSMDGIPLPAGIANPGDL